MNNANHISQDDLYLFSLQFLPEPEMVSAHAHIQKCGDCGRQLGWIQGDLAAYALTAPVAEIPVGARQRFVQRIGSASKRVQSGNVTAIDAASHPHVETMPATSTAANAGKVVAFESYTDSYTRNRAPRIGALGWAGWAVAAGVAIAGGLQFQQRQAIESSLHDTTARLGVMSDQIAKNKVVLDTLSGAGAMQVSLHLTSAGAVALPEARASYLPATGSVVLTASHLNQLQADTTYELWILPADKSAPIPAGTFQPNSGGQASLVKVDLPKGVTAAGFGVTVEHAGGTTTPTMPIVLIGE